MVPMWMAEYGRRPTDDAEEEGYDIETWTNFFDVSNKASMLHQFDISDCIKSDHVNYFVLLASKSSNSTDDDAADILDDENSYQYDICVTASTKANECFSLKTSHKSVD